MKMNGIKAVWAAGALGGLMLASGSALACSLELWFDKSPNVRVGTPVEPDEDDQVRRYSGSCGMRNSNGEVTFVEDDSPGDISRIRARFYVFVNHSGDTAVYEGFDSTGSTVFDLVVNGDTGTVTFSSQGPTLVCDSSAGCAADVDEWNSIEIDWDAGSDEISLWVNSDARFADADLTDSSATVDGSVRTIRLGNLDGAPGILAFDAYESRRTTAIGRLCVGDADGNGERGLGDLQAIFEEFQFDTLASAQPDADENGDVGLGDLQRVFEIFQFGTPACPS